jgi:tellurite resistance protein
MIQMTSTIQSPYTNEQMSVWFRGLLTLAWADGHFDEAEQNLISALTHHELSPVDKEKALEPVSPEELAATLGHDPVVAENFVRTAVMVAVSDGAYSFCEDELLQSYCAALKIQVDVLQVLRSRICDPTEQEEPVTANQDSLLLQPHPETGLDVLHPVKDWLEQMDIHDPKLARFLCKMIPSQCPFERDINLFGRRVGHIPPLCKLNPLYEQFVSLRFRALSYLADECGEDITDLVS